MSNCVAAHPMSLKQIEQAFSPLADTRPAIPADATHFQHHYGYEIPMAVSYWEWNTTFNRWSAFVTFYDGWQGFSYPQ